MSRASEPSSSALVEEHAGANPQRQVTVADVSELVDAGVEAGAGVGAGDGLGSNLVPVHELGLGLGLGLELELSRGWCTLG